MSPELDATDAMPPARRALVHEYGYETVCDLLMLVGEDVDDAVLTRLCERERQKRSAAQLKP